MITKCFRKQYINNISAWPALWCGISWKMYAQVSAEAMVITSMEKENRFILQASGQELVKFICIGCYIFEITYKF